MIIGNDRGDASDGGLRYAETDAQRVYDVLKDLGGFEPADMVLLRGESAPRAQATLIAIERPDPSHYRRRKRGAPLRLLLRPRRRRRTAHVGDALRFLVQLEQLVRGSSATFRVLAVDACRSGALTRTKGGRPAAPFDIRVDERLAEQGLVVLTSSSVNEDAQESDALKGSSSPITSSPPSSAPQTPIATAASRSRRRTATRTTRRYARAARRCPGSSTPTFRYELRGAGKLPLTQLPLPSHARATLVFPVGRTYLVMAGSDQGAVVGEVSEVATARRLSVRTGRYFVRGRTRTRSSRASSTRTAPSTSPTIA